MKNIVALLLSAVLLAGCQNQNQAAAPPASPPAPSAPGSNDALIAQLVNYTPAQARTRLADRTNMVFDTSHGTQIEYTSADGRAYLWYPGNQAILPGEWKVEQRSLPIRGTPTQLTMVCFKYGANTYNPVTGSRGAEWECAPGGLSSDRQRQSAPGDVLGLARMSAPPFQLGREPTTLAAIQVRIDSTRIDKSR